VHCIRAGLLTLLWLALLPADSSAAEPVALPALTARVTDLTATLDATQRGRLEAQLAGIERTGKAQVAVLLLPTTQPEPIEAFGIRLAEAWKIGHKGADNGVIVIVAKDDRKMRIEVGYGLEGSIPDAIAKRIIAERMAPAFKQGDFFGGLHAAIEGLDQAMGGSPAVAPAQISPNGGNTSAGGSNLLGFFLLVGLIGVSALLRAMFGVLLGSLAAAAAGGWLGIMVFGSWIAAALIGFFIFVFSFAKPASGIGSYGGSSSGGGFSDAGGSFSGGGGDFGGGGASGSW
jgi:uncharacterized protein